MHWRPRTRISTVRTGHERWASPAAYPGRVRFELTDSDAGAYRRAADFLNVNAVDVVSVQVALLPRRIDGMFALVHRPIADSGAHFWISYSPDLRSWGGHRMMLQARRGSWWDANKAGLSPRRRIFDLADPGHLLLRGDEWIFGPEAPYETQGDVAYVTFPCGTTLAPDGDTLNLYYGAAHTCIAMATGSVREILQWLDRQGSTPS